MPSLEPSQSTHFKVDRSLQSISTQRSAFQALDLGALKKAPKSKNLGTLERDDRESEGGNVGKNSPDYFKFKLKKTSKVSLNVSIRELISKRYIRGAILKDNQDFLRKTDKLKAPFGSDDFSLKLKPGTYYVKITTDGKKINYDFSLRVRKP